MAKKETRIIKFIEETDKEGRTVFRPLTKADKRDMQSGLKNKKGLIVGETLEDSEQWEDGESETWAGWLGGTERSLCCSRENSATNTARSWSARSEMQRPMHGVTGAGWVCSSFGFACLPKL